jgi:dTDP-4-dehydrorhamnose 3,5-epimerase
VGALMQVVPLPLAGAAEIRTDAHRDARGWFARLFCQNDLAAINGGRPIQQINLSHTLARGTIRGLHLQNPPHSEDKAVRCIRGRVFDVMVDLRSRSATFGQWYSIVLDSSTLNMVYIPRGFAHGFQTLEDNCEILYLHTEFHTPDAEAGYRFDSPELGIAWPLEVTELSERDKNLPCFDPSSGGLEL